jgi:hypothetical protein
MSTKDEKATELAKKIKAQAAKDKKKAAKKPVSRKPKSKEAHTLGGELVNIQKRYSKDPGKAIAVTREYCKNRKKNIPPVVTASQKRKDAEMLTKYREMEAEASRTYGQTDGQDNLPTLEEFKTLQEKLALFEKEDKKGDK